MEELIELEKCLKDKIASGKFLIDRLNTLDKVKGIAKLVRKIKQEIKFLKKIQTKGNIKKEHLQSTNLIHLEAIVSCLMSTKQTDSVLKPFDYQRIRLEVDIVGDDGATWIKVIARNARALTLISLGDGEYGQKSIIDQAYSYLQCAKCHPFMYEPPNIIFHFAYGIEIPLAKQLEQMGIVVEGTRINTNQLDRNVIEISGIKDNTNEPEFDEKVEINTVKESTISNQIRILNLDVSTLLAYVSNMTNGYANIVYDKPLLMQQAESERRRPVKPILDELFKDKELIICKTAYNNFMKIVAEIGGPKETQRAIDFMQRVKIVEDISSGRVMEKLKLGGKIKNRSRLIFATGENMKSITVSANEGFVRAARMQGIECTVFLHEPRSLSEIKEPDARISDISIPS